MSTRTPRKTAQALPLDELAAQFARGARAMGIVLPPGADEKAAQYVQELVHWSRAYNLVGPVEPAQIVERHLLDGLSVLPHARGPLLDVGSGAGLPAVPLALARPDLQVTALDSNGKKARFVRHVQRTLDLPNLAVAQVRAEQYRPDAPFACVVSRAFASLEEFLAVTAHLVAPDGRWLAMKGKLTDGERQALTAGFQITGEHELNVPGTRQERQLVVMERRR